MKQLMIYFVLVLVALNLSAQNADKKWAIGAGAGLYGSLPNKGTGFMPEMYLSRYLSPSFDVFVKDEMGWFNSEVEYYDLDLNIASLNLRYKLFNGKILSVDNSFQPYIYSGLGFIKDSQETSANYRGGIGAKFAIKQNTALYFETGIATNTRPNVIGRIKDESIWKATAGIEFSFGKVKDGDLDGVPDRLDECPDTPAGVQVDEKGCPIDTDGDGVADYVDDCPEVAGPASLKGCPDKDGDGIADKDDECPDVAGLAKLKGCPDSDNDGIADKNDECPDTPEGYKVDDKGCPIDTDGDGIVDEEDECPTVAGIPEEKGCPKKEPELVIVPVTTDFGIQSVYFPVDQSYITSYSRKKLDALVDVMNGNENFEVIVHGHTDSTASDDYNMKLSKDRVDAVIKYLKEKGISADRVKEKKAFGESKPVDSNDTVKGRQNNRRVEFKLFERTYK